MQIEAKDLVVHRADVRVLGGLSVEFPHQRWTGLVGANGSGKTTLLRALAGRIEMTGGSVVLDGIECAVNRLHRAEAIGFCPDTDSLPTSISAREYLRLIEQPSLAHRTHLDLDRLRTALAFDAFADRPLGSLSAGMKQRIVIYAAFVNGQDTVFLDEPFNWLDPICAFETKEALAELTRDGKLTLVTALHDMATLTIYCDYGVLLADGRVNRQLSEADLRQGARDFASFEAVMIAGLRSAEPVDE